MWKYIITAILLALTVAMFIATAVIKRRIQKIKGGELGNNGKN